MWDSGAINSTIKRNYINPYDSKLRANNFKYIKADGPYKTTHGLKVTFSILYFYRRKIITHHFHIDIVLGDYGIGYYMIICRDLMVKLAPKANFGHQIIE